MAPGAGKIPVHPIPETGLTSTGVHIMNTCHFWFYSHRDGSSSLLLPKQLLAEVGTFDERCSFVKLVVLAVLGIFAEPSNTQNHNISQNLAR